MVLEGALKAAFTILDRGFCEFRARAVKAGTGYQIMMNDALRTYLAETEQPVTERVLRHVLRQEIPECLRGVPPRPKRTRR